MVILRTSDYLDYIKKEIKKLSIKEGFVAWMCNRPHFFPLLLFDVVMTEYEVWSLARACEH